MPDKNIGPSPEAIARFEEGIRERYRQTMNSLPKDHKPAPKMHTTEVVRERESRTPSTSIDISPQSKVTAPNIGLPKGSKVRGPSIESMNAAAKRDAERRLIEIERKAKEEELVKELSPEVLLNKLAATERVVRKLQKEVAELKKGTDAEA